MVWWMWKSYWNGYVYNRKALKVRKIILFQVIPKYYMACVCSRYNVHSDWLTLGRYSLVMPMSQLWVCKDKAKSYMTGLLIGHGEKNKFHGIFRDKCMEKVS